jgi:hypothetical protein
MPLYNGIKDSYVVDSKKFRCVIGALARLSLGSPFLKIIIAARKLV